MTIPEPTEAETGWLIELRGNVPSWWMLTNDDFVGIWTTDSIAALRFARKQDADAYIEETGWTEAFATEHEWLDGKSTIAAASARPIAESATVAAVAQRTRALTFSALTMDEHMDLVRAVAQGLRPALSPQTATVERGQADGVEMPWQNRSTVEYLLSLIDNACDDGFDLDEDGPLVAEIRSALAASPPEQDGWQCSDFVADPCGSARCANCGKRRHEHPAPPLSAEKQP